MIHSVDSMLDDRHRRVNMIWWEKWNRCKVLKKHRVRSDSFFSMSGVNLGKSPQWKEHLDWVLIHEQNCLGGERATQTEQRVWTQAGRQHVHGLLRAQVVWYGWSLSNIYGVAISLSSLLLNSHFHFLYFHLTVNLTKYVLIKYKYITKTLTLGCILASTDINWIGEGK